MNADLPEFTAAGSPVVVSRAIEQYAIGRGSLTAIVVPWESERGRLTMAVTSSRGEGWAIEHTNLGTIRLTDLGNDHTRVEVVAEEQIPGDSQKLGALFEGFARQLQTKLQTGP